MIDTVQNVRELGHKAVHQSPYIKACDARHGRLRIAAWVQALDVVPKALRLGFRAFHAGRSHLMLVHGVLEGRDVLEGHLEEARHVEPGRQLEVVRAGVLDKLGGMKMESGFRFDRLVVQI